MTPTPERIRASDPAPRRRRVAAVLMALEGLVLLGAASIAVLDAGQPGVPRGFALGLALFLGIFAVAILLAAVSLIRRRRFGVGYGITWQLFQALVAASLLSSGFLLIGVAFLAVAIAAFLLLLGIARTTAMPLRED